MEQILHKCARTNYKIREEIQRSKSSNIKLAKKYGINRNTVQKWRHRSSVRDMTMGPIKVNTVLSETEEQIIVAVRKATELSLDDLVHILKPHIPVLTRSNLHRCLKRHGISKLERLEIAREKKKFKEYDIGYFHIDIAEVRSEEGKAYLFVAIDRICKFVYIELHKNKKAATAAQFVKNLVNKIPYRITKILTDNGAEFKYIGSKVKKSQDQHPFNAVLKAYDIEHRYTKIKHPWTNGQVERFNRTIKEKTVKCFYYTSFDKLSEHLDQYVQIHNFATKLKALKFKSPYDFLIERLKNKPHLFINKLSYHSLGLYI
jgi:transposase-like protein